MSSSAAPPLTTVSHRPAGARDAFRRARARLQGHAVRRIVRGLVAARSAGRQSEEVGLPTRADFSPVGESVETRRIRQLHLAGAIRVDQKDLKAAGPRRSL